MDFDCITAKTCYKYVLVLHYSNEWVHTETITSISWMYNKQTSILIAESAKFPKNLETTSKKYKPKIDTSAQIHGNSCLKKKIPAET
jgi:hypothetical protein